MRRHRAASGSWLVAVALLVAACRPAGGDRPPPPTALAERETPEASPEPSVAPTTPPAAPTEAPEALPVIGDAWRQLADAPAARTEVASAAHAGRLWVVGGFAADGSASSAVFVMDPGDASWSEAAPLPEAVHHAALVSDGERLYVIGGYVGAGFERPTTAVWAMRQSGNWEAAPPLPEPRAAGAAAWDGARIVFAGGVGPGGVAAEVYALAGEEWEPLGVLAEARQHLAATTDGEGRTWVLGGRHTSLATNVGTIELLVDAEVELVAADLTPRSGVGAFWLAGLGACLVGGETPDGTSAAVECVDAAAQLTELPPLDVARHGIGVALLDDGAYAVMGGEEPGLFVSAVVERLPAER